MYVPFRRLLKPLALPSWEQLHHTTKISVVRQLWPSRARRLLLVQHGAESEMAFFALAAGKDLAVLGHGDGEISSARRHRPRPDAFLLLGSSLPQQMGKNERIRDQWRLEVLGGRNSSPDLANN